MTTPTFSKKQLQITTWKVNTSAKNIESKQTFSKYTIYHYAFQKKLQNKIKNYTIYPTMQEQKSERYYHKFSKKLCKKKLPFLQQMKIFLHFLSYFLSYNWAID